MYQSVVVLYYSCTIGLAFLLFAGHTDSSLSQYFLAISIDYIIGILNAETYDTSLEHCCEFRL